jgi:hypothetical protein
VRRVG